MKTRRSESSRPAWMPKVLPALLCTAVLLLTGCGRHNAETGPDASSPKILRVGNGSEPQDIDPQVVQGNVEYRIILALFEGLVTSDPNTLEPIPGVAESWETSPDGLVYTFHLRADARWSDGKPVTAGDFVRSYQRILTPALASPYAYILFYVAGAEDYYRGKLADFAQAGFKALDDRTLQFTLRQPTPFFLHLLCYYPWYPVPVSVIEKFGGSNRRGSAWTRPENFISNGPFMLKEWRPNQEIVAIRSPTYWDRAHVKLDEIVFYPIENTETEEHMFRTGQLDITMEVSLSKIPVYQREHPDSIRMDPFYGTYFYCFNIKRAPFTDPRVRRAFALAIDRESLVKNVLLGGEQPAQHIVPPDIAGYNSRSQLTGDVPEARRLLAEAGYPGGQGFPKVELLYNTLEKHRVMAEAVQRMWKKNLDIDVSLTNEEWKVYLSDLQTRNYQLARFSWSADYADPHGFLDLWATDAGNNDTNWGNPEYDRLLRSSLGAKTVNERYEIYQRMEKILLDEMPLIPVYFYTQPRLISPRVKGYRVTPLDNYPWKFADLAD